jgi:hypothetical protein
VILSAAAVHADPVTDLVEFTAGTTARADEVNANFSEMADSINDNDARVAALEEEIAELRELLSNVLSLDQFLSLEMVNERPAVRITGANLQIVNGTGETASSNGTGNLLIGYDERREETFRVHCSLGTNPDNGTPVTDQIECDIAGGVWAVNHTGGSHYLVVGSEHNYSRWGGIVVGLTNTSNFDFASVSGGSYNIASGENSSVSGGSNNTASGTVSSVSGGQLNRASDDRSSVSGGFNNTASGDSSSVSGGQINTASGSASSVSGGRENAASGRNSSVSGGINRDASGEHDWAAGSLSEDE